MKISQYLTRIPTGDNQNVTTYQEIIFFFFLVSEAGRTFTKFPSLEYILFIIGPQLVRHNPFGGHITDTDITIHNSRKITVRK